MSSFQEVLQLIEKQGRAWEEYKNTNDALIKAKADGQALSSLEEKLQKITLDLESWTDQRAKIEEALTKMGRPHFDTDDKSGAEELRAFNLSMMAEQKRMGKEVGVGMDAKQYQLYKKGFFNLVRGVKYEHLAADEQKALIAGSDPDGGYLLPASTQGRIISRIYEKSVMRQICDVQSISGPKISGPVDNDENDAGWVSELGTRSDTDNAQIGKWEIEAFELYAQPRASQTILDDAVYDVEAWLANKTGDKLARVESTAFWQGTGVGQARGLATYTTAATADETRAWGQIEHVLSGANGDFHTTKLDPLHDLIGAFKDEYLQSANWVLRREVRTKARKLKEATSDRYLWEPSLQVGQPDVLMGYPVRVDQYMPALATGSLSMALGNFKEAYTIVDRLGIRTLRDPYTSKPYVRFYSTKRTGGGAMNYEAVKFLKFAS